MILARIESAAVATALGAILVAATSAFIRLGSPSSWAVYGAVVGAVGGWIAAGWHRRGRRAAWFGLAVLLYLIGVAAMPILGALLELSPPLVGRLSRDDVGRQAWGMYAATPLALASAVAFVPASIGGGLIWSILLDELARRRRDEPTAVDTSAEAAAADARFERRLVMVTAAIVLAAIGGYLLLFFTAQSIGY